MHMCQALRSEGHSWVWEEKESKLLRAGTGPPTPLHSIVGLKSLTIPHPSMTFQVVLKVHPSVKDDRENFT